MTTVLTDFKPIILSALDTLRLGEMSRGEKFKSIAYKKAIDALKRHDGPVYSADHIKDLPGIGKKIFEKIVEITQTGALQAAERMKETTNVGAMEILLNIHGIGPVKAKDLIGKGIRTIADLRAALAADPDLLNETQQTGLFYYEDGIQRIPRAEMIVHEEVLMTFLNKDLNGTIVGSYRRGAKDSGDIDMLITYGGRVTEKKAQTLFQEYVEKLTEKGYVISKLVSGAKKWMGYVRLGSDGVARRLDLLLTPPKEFAYALLYFTGSDRFNVAFRKHCLDLGYTLNEHIMKITEKGLSKGVKEVPPMASEEDIFAFVGLRFVGPTERLNGSLVVPV